jgi:hypothetical protein
MGSVSETVVVTDLKSEDTQLLLNLMAVVLKVFVLEFSKLFLLFFRVRRKSTGDIYGMVMFSAVCHSISVAARLLRSPYCSTRFVRRSPLIRHIMLVILLFSRDINRRVCPLGAIRYTRTDFINISPFRNKWTETERQVHSTQYVNVFEIILHNHEYVVFHYINSNISEMSCVRHAVMFDVRTASTASSKKRERKIKC